jgi:hypothetical protein
MLGWFPALVAIIAQGAVAPDQMGHRELLLLSLAERHEVSQRLAEHRDGGQTLQAARLALSLWALAAKLPAESSELVQASRIHPAASASPLPQVPLLDKARPRDGPAVV